VVVDQGHDRHAATQPPDRLRVLRHLLAAVEDDVVEGGRQGVRGRSPVPRLLLFPAPVREPATD
jgi:hypothetical protein